MARIDVCDICIMDKILTPTNRYWRKKGSRIHVFVCTAHHDIPKGLDEAAWFKMVMEAENVGHAMAMGNARRPRLCPEGPSAAAPAQEKKNPNPMPPHNCQKFAQPYKSNGPLGHGFECGICGKFIQAG